MRKIMFMLVAAAMMAFAASPALAQGSQPTATVAVADQSSDGTTVTVPEATIQGSDGWVAIHLDDGGMPLVPQTAGHAYIEEGTTQDVTVQLDTPVDSSQTLYAMIHTDNPGDQAYRFPATATQEMPEDPPVMAGEDIVVKPFDITYDAAASDLPETGGPSLALITGLGSAALLLAGGGLLVARRIR